MDLTQLETFLAIVEERGFSRAALRLHRTQPAVSQAIRKLEEDLGERLFERGSRDGTLTPAGEVLHGYAGRLLRLRGEARSAVEELRSLARGELLLAANEYTTHFLLPVLQRFREAHPHLVVNVRRSLASRIPEQVLSREVELGVLTFVPENDGLEACAVYHDQVVLVAAPGHALAGAHEVAIAELGALNFIGHAVASPLRREITELFARARTPLHMGVQLPSLEAIKRFVAAGAGVAILPELAVAHELEAGALVRIPVSALNGCGRRLWLIRRHAGAPSHAAQALERALRRLAHERGAPYAFSWSSAAPQPASRPEFGPTR